MISLLASDALKEIDKEMPYIEEVERLAHSETLMDIISDSEIDSIRTNKEDTLVICGDNVVKLVGAKSAEAASVFHFPSVVSDVCGSTPPVAVHFHGPYLSVHSERDKATHKYLFEKGFRAGCAVGIDGLRCLVPSGHEYSIPWSEEFYEKAAGRGVISLDDVKMVTCFQLEGASGKDCTIRTRDGKPSYQNIFSEQIWETQEDALRPFLFFGEEDTKPFIEKTVSKKTRCVISETQDPPVSAVVKNNLASLALLRSLSDSGKKKRILACFSSG